MHRLPICALVAAGLITSHAATAVEPISYTSVDLGLVRTESDDNGANLRVRLGLTRAWFLAAEGTWFGEKNEEFDIDRSEITAGVGYALRPSDTISYYGQVSLLQVDEDVERLNADEPGGPVGLPFPVGTSDDTGQEFRIGARFAPSTRFEGEVSLRHRVLDTFNGTRTYLAASGHYYFTDNIGIGLEGEFGQFDGATASLRVRF